MREKDLVSLGTRDTHRRETIETVTLRHMSEGKELAEREGFERFRR